MRQLQLVQLSLKLSVKVIELVVYTTISMVKVYSSTVQHLDCP